MVIPATNQPDVFCRPTRPNSRRSDQSERVVAVCIDSREGTGRERLKGVYDHAQERDWRLILRRNESRDALRELGSMALDGAILFDRSAALHRHFRRRRIRCVEAGARHLDLDDAAVFIDDSRLSQLAVEHFLAARFEHFAFCGLAAGLLANSFETTRPRRASMSVTDR